MGGVGMILVWLVPIALVVWLVSRAVSGREEYLSRRSDLKVGAGRTAE